MYEQYLQLSNIPCGAVLNRIMIKEGISQSQLAERSGIVRQRICDYLANRRRITVEASLNLEKALRIGITDGSTTYIFAPVSGGAYTDGKSVSAYTAEGKVTTFTAQTLTSVGLSNADFGTILQGTDRTLTVFVWYEGNDVNCTSPNAVNVEALKVSFVLSGAMN